MPYGNYKTVQEVAIKYQVAVTVDTFIDPIPMPVDAAFESDLAYMVRHVDVKMSEAAISEFLIAPILKEIWKDYADYLLFWSHVALTVGDDFEGFPDYLFTKRSSLGLVRDKPYLLVVEAKKDDFEGGWAQCLAALLAAQIINNDLGLTLYGAVSNGDVWQFAKLQRREFTRDPRSFTIADLTELFAVLHYVFEQAKQQAILNGKPENNI